MFVYDALSKVRSDIEKRKKKSQIRYALKAGGLGLLATAVGVIIWFWFIIGWTWIWI